VFRDDLDGRPLLSNRSEWFRYAFVSNRRWHWRNLVLLGDALRTGHPSVGSGRGWRSQDAIALFEACVACADVPEQLAEFERRREAGSDALQQAAIRGAAVVRDGPRASFARPGIVAYDYLRAPGASTIRTSARAIRARCRVRGPAPEGVAP